MFLLYPLKWSCEFNLHSLGMVCHVYCVYLIILSCHELIPVGYMNDCVTTLLNVFVSVHVSLILVFARSVFVWLWGQTKGNDCLLKLP